MKTILSALLSFLFFSGAVYAADQPGVVSETLVKSIRSWDGSKLPSYPKGQPEITVLKITIPPGARLPLHKHPVINAAFMLQGELQVTTATGKTMKIKKGDSLVEIVGQWHYGENRGRKPVVILVFYAGIKGTPVTIKQNP